MNSVIQLLLIRILLPASCQPKQYKTKSDYKLGLDDDGIIVEKFESTIIDENRFNNNNKVFKVGTAFKYDFKHLTKTGEAKYFKIHEDLKSWEFVDTKSMDSLIVKSVIIEVMNENPMAKFIPDYNQTPIAFKLIEGIPFSMSGAIENEANIWIHPPRDHYFKILELNPFPYIKAPYKIGTKWTWRLMIGNQWADDRWKTWEGNIDNKYEYEITDKVTLETNLCSLECFVIESKAVSRIGTTALKAYYHPKFGFVKLNYTNIDQSKTILTLTAYVMNENRN